MTDILRRKGISLMISVVLMVLIAISITSIMMAVFSSNLSRTTEDIDDEAGRFVSCSDLDIEISGVAWKGNVLNIGFSNQGSFVAEGVVFSIMFSDGSREFYPDKFDEELEPGVTGSASFELDKPVESIRLVSGNCPEKFFDRELSPCPDGMAFIDASESDYEVSEADDFCIFRYEASRNDATEFSEGVSELPVSQEGVVPWNGIKRTSSGMSAEKACDNSGLSLPSNRQWQIAASVSSEGQDEFFGGNTGPGSDCVSAGGEEFCLTGSGPDSWCNGFGVCGMKGNLWEWTSDTFEKGDACDLGVDGYVESWSGSNHCPELLSSFGVDSFDRDYYTSVEDGGAVLRGGSWKDGEKAGPYAMMLNRSEEFDGEVTGFRCVLG